MTDASYAPCHTGLHVCGKSADELDPITVQNFPMRAASYAEDAFAAIRQRVGDLSGEDADLIVDLMIRSDCDHTLGIRRQDLRTVAQIAETFQ